MNTIELARQLGHAIQEEESYKAVTLAGDAIDADPELTALIAKFSEKRDSIAGITDTDKLDSIDKELEELYGKIMSNPKMKAFEEAKHEFGHLMDRVLAIVAKSADGENPDTAEPDEHCHGDCCSCHDECHH
ncbi:MAG: YlbF family regulator [Clostridia bacterium]|nr:YlbF family regulator [Clostridia bacterium]